MDVVCPPDLPKRIVFQPSIFRGKQAVKLPEGGVPSPKLIAKTPENGWLGRPTFILGFGLFSGAFAVSLPEGKL